MDNSLSEEESNSYFLQALQNKRYSMEEMEDDPLSKRAKMAQQSSYNYMSNISSQPSQQSSNPSPLDPLPLLHPHPNTSQHAHYPSMQQHTPYSQSYYGSNVGYPGSYSSSSQSGNAQSSTFNFPFLPGLPPPSSSNLNSGMQSSQYSNPNMSSGSSLDTNYRYPSSPMAPPTSSSQVYYFSSPPYMPSRQSYSHPQITTLQQSNPPQYQSPLTSMLHDPSLSMDPDHNSPFDPSNLVSLNNQIGVYKYNRGSLNTLANLASGNDSPSSPLDDYGHSYHETKVKKKPKVIDNGMLKKKEGLEESSIRIMNLLQQRGKMIFKEIHETLGIDYRRAYDILNILLTTNLITKTGKKRENKMPFVYQDGTPTEEPIDIRDVLENIKREEESSRALQERLALLEQELEKEEPSLKVVSQLQDIDAAVANDPMYKDLLKQIST